MKKEENKQTTGECFPPGEEEKKKSVGEVRSRRRLRRPESPRSPAGAEDAEGSEQRGAPPANHLYNIHARGGASEEIPGARSAGVD